MNYENQPLAVKAYTSVKAYSSVVQPVRMQEDRGLGIVGDFFQERSSQERTVEGMEVHGATE